MVLGADERSECWQFGTLEVLPSHCTQARVVDTEEVIACAVTAGVGLEELVLAGDLLFDDIRFECRADLRKHISRGLL